MRKALPLAALAMLTAGCGRTYSAADVQQALGATNRAIGMYGPAATDSVFATVNAVTQLRIEETPELPRAVYRGGGVVVERYRNPDEAWVAAHSSGWRSFSPVAGRSFVIRREANVVVTGPRDRVTAALARLH